VSQEQMKMLPSFPTILKVLKLPFPSFNVHLGTTWYPSLLGKVDSDNFCLIFCFLWMCKGSNNSSNSILGEGGTLEAAM
jgi:hypothetical protein